MKIKSSNWVYIAPDVRDLQEFDEIRPDIVLKTEAVEVASLGDAGLRFATEYASRSIRHDLGISCQVVAMGNVPYYKSQNIRKQVLELNPTPVSITRYRTLLSHFGNRTITAKKKNVEEGSETEKVFFKVPSARGNIASNLACGTPWYLNLFKVTHWDADNLEKQRKNKSGVSLERLWFDNIKKHEGRNLMALVEHKEMWDTEAEQLFVQAFHESLRKLYGKEKEAARRGGSRSIQERIQDLNDDIYRTLSRCKTREILRRTVTDIFAKAGRPATVVDHTTEIWGLLNHQHDWKKARDLALLALASYKGTQSVSIENEDNNSEKEGE